MRNRALIVVSLCLVGTCLIPLTGCVPYPYYRNGYYDRDYRGDYGYGRGGYGDGYRGGDRGSYGDGYGYSRRNAPYGDYNGYY